jgi:hypothetical protein
MPEPLSKTFFNTPWLQAPAISGSAHAAQLAEHGGGDDDHRDIGGEWTPGVEGQLMSTITCALVI